MPGRVIVPAAVDPAEVFGSIAALNEHIKVLGAIDGLRLAHIYEPRVPETRQNSRLHHTVVSRRHNSSWDTQALGARWTSVALSCTDRPVAPRNCHAVMLNALPESRNPDAPDDLKETLRTGGVGCSTKSLLQRLEELLVLLTDESARRCVSGYPAEMRAEIRPVESEDALLLATTIITVWEHLLKSTVKQKRMRAVPQLLTGEPLRCVLLVQVRGHVRKMSACRLHEAAVLVVHDQDKVRTCVEQPEVAGPSNRQI